MDLWDLTKVLFRRWYIALPLLAATAVVVVFVGSAVKPDYSAKGHLQLIPPTAPAQTDKVQSNVNPWVDLGVYAIGQAAVVKVTDQTVLDNLVASGLTDSFTVASVDTRLEIEAVASSPTVATATVRAVMDLLKKDILAEQTPYGVDSGHTITALALDDGATVKIVTSKVKRGIAAAGAASLLVTVAGTLATDAMLRRRRRVAEDELRPGPIPGPRPEAPDASALWAGGPRIVRQSLPSTPPPGVPPRIFGQPAEEPRYAVPGMDPIDQHEEAAAGAPLLPGTVDEFNSTIVLPLTRSSWSRDEDKSRPR